jgi:MFS superfamily sulfate permease-like transporter
VCILSTLQIVFLKDLNHRVHWFEHNKITLPVHLITMITWIFIVWLRRLDKDPWSIEIVGEIKGGLPQGSTPNFSIIGKLIAPSLSVSLISFVIGVAVVKKFAQKYNEKEKMGRQVAAMGMGCFVGCFTSCYPPCASLIRAAIIDSVGPASPFHCIITSVLLGIVMIALTGVFHYLPNATLAAVIYTTLLRLLDLPYALQLYRKDKRDFFVWCVAFLATALHGGTPLCYLSEQRASLRHAFYVCMQ